MIDKSGTKIPSDWAGLGYTVFDNTEERSRDKVYNAVTKIREQISIWQPIKNSDCLTAIAGDWWQFVVNVEIGAVMSLMEITATESRIPMLLGTSWSANGELIARYRSQSARYDDVNHILHYSWEGDHPREDNLPHYFGVGEIHFRPSIDEVAFRGEGWFSSSRSSDVKEALTKSTVYVRATTEEIATMQSTARDKRVSLIQAKLTERNQIDL